MPTSRPAKAERAAGNQPGGLPPENSVTQENQGTPNEGRRAVYRAVKSYLAANGLTKAEIAEMVRREVVEQLRQVIGKTMSDPAYVGRVLVQRGTYDLREAMQQGAKAAVAAAIEVKIKGL